MLAWHLLRGTNLVRHKHHHAYACWDSEETRHFYEDILGMPLIATLLEEDPLRSDGSSYCHTFFEIADGSTLAFFEHTSLNHPKYFNARSGCHRHVAFEVEGDAAVRQFKRKLDAAGVQRPNARAHIPSFAGSASGRRASAVVVETFDYFCFRAFVFSHSVSAMRPVVEKSVKMPSVPKSKYAMYSALASPS